MKHLTRTLVLLLSMGFATTTVVGCKKSDTKAQDEAVKARKEADDKAAEAAKAKKEADEKTAVAQKEAADKAIAANAEVRMALQKDIDAADRKLTYLKEKAAKATGAMKKNADAAAAEVDKRREAVKTNMASLEAATGDAWTTAKGQVEADIAALNKSVETLETSLKK